MASFVVPPLTRGNSTISSESGAETDEVSGTMGHGFLLQERDGVLILPDRYRPEAGLLCPFQILDCEKVFPDVVSFKTHVFSHFGNRGLPTSASCFLCDQDFTQTDEDDVALAWNDMLSHMVYHHYRQGEQLAVVRTNFALMRWMYSRRLINDHQLKRAQLMPRPTYIPGSRPGEDEIINLPRAPMAPPAASPLASPAALLAQRRMPLRNQSYTLNAGSRADRRQRDDTRHLIRS